MRTVRILTDAVLEASEAAVWYESQQQGLGIDFFAALDTAIGLIEEGVVPLTPMHGSAGAVGAKRLILNRFPYDVVAIETAAEVIVVAVAHQARKPGYWRKRHRG